MLRIKKKNHAFLTIDAEPSILNEISDYFTFYVPGYKFMPAFRNKVWDGKIRLFNVQSKELYSGLYHYVEKLANEEGRNYKIELEDSQYGYPNEKQEVSLDFLDTYNLTVKNKPIKVRDYQLEAISHCLNNKQALLLSPTASGKSLIIYCVVRWFTEEFNKKVLIIVPTTSLVEQMYSDFADYSKHDIGFEDWKPLQNYEYDVGDEDWVADLDLEEKLEANPALKSKITGYGFIVLLASGMYLLLKPQTK